jgi:large subunit ribosomal protein L3
MGKLSRPRRGSLQYYPRKRALKFTHKINFSPIKSSSDSAFLGFLTYKAGMATVLAKDKTDKSLTANKKVSVPVTILEAPAMKIFSVRFLKHNKPIKDIIVSNERELKRKTKVPKSLSDFGKSLPKEEDYEDIQVIAYSLAKQTSIKKTPDLIELALSGSDKKAKLEHIKSLIGKEISLSDFLKSLDSEKNLLDVRGVTKGKGFSGPVKRFGITLRNHKSEKGVRKVGSIAPWHPARVTFRTPIAGQLGLFSRISFNHKILTSGNISENDINPKHGFKKYGKIKTSYIIVKGSVPGPNKRAVIITPAQRATKYRSKRKLEFQELITK